MKGKPVRPGDKLPVFSLPDQHGNMVSVEQYFGRPFVLYFYPKDDTPGCTAEACSFRDAYSELRHLDAEVLGVSADSPASHLAFAKNYNLPFVLLSDEKNEVRKLLGVPKSMFGLVPGRVTYIVDRDGVVQHIFDSQLQAKQHVREALAHLKK
ncbi:MAG TPA: peroxiredoxin [Saprospiraceae bacterium]|nr:peroxiredoxin [Saprospiraceae bacterium]